MCKSGKVGKEKPMSPVIARLKEKGVSFNGTENKNNTNKGHGYGPSMHTNFSMQNWSFLRGLSGSA